MTNRTAAVLAFLLVSLLLADWLLGGGALLTWLGQQLIRATEWVAFWR